MTSASVDAIEGDALDPPRPHAWSLAELFFVGPGALLLFPIAWLLRAALGLDEAELLVGFVFFHLAHLLNDPHFAVTYLLFYRDVRARAFDPSIPALQRARFVISGFVVPSVLVICAGVALFTRAPQVLGWMAQLMYLLVGWHYAKQGFGVLMVLSSRRGAQFTVLERRVLLAHAYAAWAFSWAQPATASGTFEEKGVVYWAPGRPFALEVATGALFLASSLALIWVLVRKWALVRNERAAPFPLVPLLAYLVTLWLFTVFTSLDPLVRYAIPAFHALQYGYFVWLLRRNEAHAQEGPPTFGPPVSTRLLWLFVSAVALGWLLFRGLPSALDASLVPGMHTTSEDLGATPFFAAFYVVVNLHHYFMDHVIWRREHRETRWLTRDPERVSLPAISD